MSIKDYKQEQNIDDINEVIESIRKTKKRLDGIEKDLIDITDNLEKELHKM